MVDDKVSAWLRSAGLSRFTPRFHAALISPHAFLQLSSTDLEVLGVDGPADRKRLIDLIADLRRTSADHTSSSFCNTKNNHAPNNPSSSSPVPNHKKKKSSSITRATTLHTIRPPSPSKSSDFSLTPLQSLSLADRHESRAYTRHPQQPSHSFQFQHQHQYQRPDPAPQRTRTTPRDLNLSYYNSLPAAVNRQQLQQHQQQQQQHPQLHFPRKQLISRRQSSFVPVSTSSSLTSSSGSYSPTASISATPRPSKTLFPQSFNCDDFSSSSNGTKPSSSFAAAATTTGSVPYQSCKLPPNSAGTMTMSSTGGTNARGEAPATVTVCVRKRPLSRKEVQARDRDIVTVNHDDACLFVHELKEKVDLTKYVETHTFSFDNVFGENVGNRAVYDGTAKPLVDTLFTGGRATCFAYGQTGAGKTFTMAGDGDENPGLYTLAIADVFDRIRELERQAWHDAEERGIIDDFEPPDPPEVWISFYEIYGTRLQDLLNRGAKLECREDANNEVQIVGLTERLCEVEEDVLEFIKSGSSLRSTGVTGANDDSSRSHAVFQIELREPPPSNTRQDANAALRESLLRTGVRNTSRDTHSSQKMKKKGDEIGRLCFIDLAGSERGSDTASSTRQTRMEGAEINKSLLALKECIRAMDKRKDHTPFRGSKLTQVLKASFLGKKCRTVMIANISPAASNVEHTLNTLRYSDRVKEIKRERSNSMTSTIRRTTLHGANTFSHGVGGSGTTRSMNTPRTATMNALATKQHSAENTEPFVDDLTSSAGNAVRSVTMRCRMDSDSALDDQLSNGGSNRSNSGAGTGMARSVTSRRLTRTKNNVRPDIPLSVSYPNSSSTNALVPNNGNNTLATTMPHLHGSPDLTLSIRPVNNSNALNNPKDSKMRRRASKAPVDNAPPSVHNGSRIAGPGSATATHVLRGTLKPNGNAGNVNVTVKNISTTDVLRKKNNADDAPLVNSRSTRHREREKASTDAALMKRSASPPVTRQRAKQLDRKREEELMNQGKKPEGVDDFDDDDDEADDDDESYCDDDLEEDDDKSIKSKKKPSRSTASAAKPPTISSSTATITATASAASGSKGRSVRASNVAESAMNYYLGVGGVKKEKEELNDDDLLFSSTDDFDALNGPKDPKDDKRKKSAKEGAKSSGCDSSSTDKLGVKKGSVGVAGKKEVSSSMKQVIRLHHMQIEELMRLTEADVALVNAIEKGEIDSQEYAMKLSVNISQKLDIVNKLRGKLLNTSNNLLD